MDDCNSRKKNGRKIEKKRRKRIRYRDRERRIEKEETKRGEDNNSDSLRNPNDGCI